MQALAAAAIGLLIVTSIVIGGRLLLLHRRTGSAPELLLGAELLLVCGFGYPLRIISDRVSPEWAGTFVIVSDIAIGIGMSLLFVFTRRVFRPQETWARVVAAVGVAVVLGKVLYDCFRVYSQGVIDPRTLPHYDNLLRMGPLMAVYCWMAWESLRYHGMMRRRVKLGLADVAVSNRFLLWGLMAVLSTLGIAVNAVGIMLRVDTGHSPGILLFSAWSGITEAGLLIFALMPPDFYLSWIRAREAGSEA